MNAKEELLREIPAGLKIKCAEISHGYQWNDEPKVPTFELKLNYNETDYVDFLKKLDFTYDSGYGGQELYGIVWLNDGTWLSRRKYDGSEWWKHNKLPEIPLNLLN